jgi:hypothetical protein
MTCVIISDENNGAWYSSQSLELVSNSRPEIYKFLVSGDKISNEKTNNKLIKDDRIFDNVFDNVVKLPIKIDVVKDQNLTLRAKEALLFELERDNSEKLICCIKDDIGVFVYAETRYDLIKQLNAQILMLWREYALESDAKLSKSGQKLKKSLLEAFAEQ